MTPCPHCQTPNRPAARFCVRCGQPLAQQVNGPSGAFQWWLGQMQRSLSLVWAQGIAEIRAFYNEWILRRPVLSGKVITSPQQTQVTIVVQGLWGPVPFGAGQSQQPGLLVQVQDAHVGRSVDVILIGAYQGTAPQRGDEVLVWGQWDASANAYRAWRIQISQRSGQPTNLELTTGRPMPFALLSLLLITFVSLVCLCSLLVR